MESLSRPFHSRKLSNASSFSANNAHRHNYAGATGIDVLDFRQIFGSSQAASSIPVLDLSTIGGPADASDFSSRSSKPDYSKIFGRFPDEDIAVSYDNLFASDKARTPSSTRATSQDLDDLSHQCSDDLKQFNVSYHKISQKSKDGLDGTRHVAQLHAIPGFTCFIDETAPPLKMEAEKPKSSPVHVSIDCHKEGFTKKKPSENTVRKRSKHRSGESFSEDEVFETFEMDLKPNPSTVLSPSDLPTNVDNHKTYPKRSTSINFESFKPDASGTDPPRFSPTYFHEELDVNSSAAASAAALKKAIEKAQESIRIAKESVGRKKKGLRSFSSKNIKGGLKVEGRMEDVTACEEQKCNDEVRGVFERAADSSQVFPDAGSNRKRGCTVDFPDFMDSEKLSIAKKVIDEIQGRISESTKECYIPVQSSNESKDHTIFSHSTQNMGETESRPLDSPGKDEYATLSSDAVDTEKSKNDTSDFVLSDETSNISIDDDEGKIQISKPTACVLEHQGVVKETGLVERACEPEEVGKQGDVRITQRWEHGAGTRKSASLSHEGRENDACGALQEDGASAQRSHRFFVHESRNERLGDSDGTVEVDKSRESKENEDEVKASNAHELVEGSNNLTVSQKLEVEKQVSQGCNQNDNEKRLNADWGLLQNEKEEVVEEEQVENIEIKEKHREKNNEASDEGLGGVSQWLESENESKDDCNTESHKEEEIREMFYDVCELELSGSAQTCDNSIEEIEVTLQDDCEMNQEDNHRGESKGEILNEARDHELGDNPTKENDIVDVAGHVKTGAVEYCEVDMRDDNAETTQEADDGVRGSPMLVTRASCEFPVEETEAIKGADALEGEFFEKTSRDQTVSDNNEDECEVKSEKTSRDQTAFKGEFFEKTSRDHTIPDINDDECEVKSEKTSRDQTTLEPEIFDKTYPTASDENEDECEVKSDNLGDLGSADTGFGQKETEVHDVLSEPSSCSIRGVEKEAGESDVNKNIINEEKIVIGEEGESNVQPPHKEIPESTNETKDSGLLVSNETEKTMDVNETRTNEYREKEDETGPREVAGKEQRRMVDAVTDREREREKNRLAVDRAIREARERAFADARERAERAAVEKATEEVRRRMMADAREKAAKASVGSKSSSERTSAQSKLRAERAAVERATTEARQRALEKAISQKSVSEAGPDGSSSSDLHSGSRTSSESALRSKAKLEKHNRIMERAANALAEKEKRDLLAQKEQAERNRLAEHLDADIKRWSSGKEGNLRALLSTLQYILGADSGWKAVPLTEMISSSAVKKAYRKATLCVHPDKLQQRGASIQHKYICEKVFDLLKAAWNRFNSEER